MLLVSCHIKTFPFFFFFLREETLKEKFLTVNDDKEKYEKDIKEAQLKYVSVVRLYSEEESDNCENYSYNYWNSSKFFVGWFWFDDNLVQYRSTLTVQAFHESLWFPGVWWNVWTICVWVKFSHFSKKKKKLCLMKYVPEHIFIKHFLRKIIKWLYSYVC